MKKVFLVFLSMSAILGLLAKDAEPRKLCSSLADCVSKAESTDIHRKKISFFDEAINVYGKSDKSKKLYKVFLLRANSIVKEASGDTGYKGEIPLKVSHKPEYKASQFEKAKNDLKRIEENIPQFSTDERKLYDELKLILDSVN